MIAGFPPVARRDARVLIVGSMPGEQSLVAGQYYANPHNAFWRLMGKLCGAGPNLPYGRRCARLRAAGIALWDVIATCERDGSLDSAIATDSQVINDFAEFFRTHARIELICFNGGKAAQSFRRQIAPTLPSTTLRYVQLPSTSPAHAALNFDAKLQRWRDALHGFQSTAKSSR